MKYSKLKIKISENNFTILYKTKKFYAQSHQIRAIEARIIILEGQLDAWGNNLKPA